tara:strand:- start:154 stop:333 length:180 start_codon:yes stop_codon:yes gene_type:complete
MNSLQLQILMVLSSGNSEKPKTLKNLPKKRKEPKVRQFKRPYKNKRANRHIFTNKDMKM